MMNNLIEQIKHDEGFVGNPYDDSLGIPTIGYGTKLPLDEKEASMLLEKRLMDVVYEIENNVDFFSDLPKEAQDIILNMAYNMGVPRLMKFKKMWKALSERDYREASKEMVDSRWYNQVGQRANELVLKMSAVA